jgi:hypothetical protein
MHEGDRICGIFAGAIPHSGMAPDACQRFMKAKFSLRNGKRFRNLEFVFGKGFRLPEEKELTLSVFAKAV